MKQEKIGIGSQPPVCEVSEQGARDDRPEEGAASDPAVGDCAADVLMGIVARRWHGVLRIGLGPPVGDGVRLRADCR